MFTLYRKEWIRGKLAKCIEISTFRNVLTAEHNRVMWEHNNSLYNSITGAMVTFSVELSPVLAIEHRLSKVVWE